MTLGPMQFVAIGLDEPTFDGSILQALNEIRDLGLVRLVDLLAVHKTLEGDLDVLEVSDLSKEEVMLAGAAIGGLIGLGSGDAAVAEVAALDTALDFADTYEFGLAEEDIAEIAADIPPGGASLMMLIEHRWLIPLRDAVRGQGGVVLSEDFLSIETLLGMGEDLAALAELEAGLEEDE